MYAHIMGIRMLLLPAFFRFTHCLYRTAKYINAAASEVIKRRDSAKTICGCKMPRHTHTHILTHLFTSIGRRKELQKCAENFVKRKHCCFTAANMRNDSRTNNQTQRVKPYRHKRSVGVASAAQQT